VPLIGPCYAMLARPSWKGLAGMRERQEAELLITEIDGIGEAEYDQVNAELGVDTNGGGDWPDGLISHTAATTERGLIVIEIWESREAQEAEMPKLGAAIQKTGLH